MVVNYYPLTVIRVNIHVLHFKYRKTSQSIASILNVPKNIMTLLNLVITKRLGFAPKDFVGINGVPNDGWQHNYSPPKYDPQ